MFGSLWKPRVCRSIQITNPILYTSRTKRSTSWPYSIWLKHRLKLDIGYYVYKPSIPKNPCYVKSRHNIPVLYTFFRPFSLYIIHIYVYIYIYSCILLWPVFYLNEMGRNLTFKWGWSHRILISYSWFRPYCYHGTYIRW